jgi:hypothetical protein
LPSAQQNGMSKDSNGKGNTAVRAKEGKTGKEEEEEEEDDREEEDEDEEDRDEEDNDDDDDQTGLASLGGNAACSCPVIHAFNHSVGTHDISSSSLVAFCSEKGKEPDRSVELPFLCNSIIEWSKNNILYARFRDSMECINMFAFEWYIRTWFCNM